MQPTHVYFGAKDAAQCIAIAKLIRELNFDIELVICETVRESDGLAMSSRNRRLSETQRKQATVISRALFAGEQYFRENRQFAAIKDVCSVIKNVLESEPAFKFEYLSFAEVSTGLEADPTDLVETSLPLTVSVAGFVGDVRLIDNIVIDFYK